MISPVGIGAAAAFLVLRRWMAGVAVTSCFCAALTSGMLIRDVL